MNSTRNYSREEIIVPAAVDIWAPGDNIPVPDRSEDFIVSSHVVEHLPNLIAAFIEWDRIIRDGGYVFMIVPLKGALPADKSRELTPLPHFVEDYNQKMTLDTHPTDGVPGERAGHYHTFTPIPSLRSSTSCARKDFARGHWWLAKMSIRRWETDLLWSLR